MNIVGVISNKTSKAQLLESSKQEAVKKEGSAMDAVSKAAEVSKGEPIQDPGLYTSKPEDTKDTAKEEEENKDSQASLEEASKIMTEEDLRQLIQEGMSLELYEIGRLDRAILRIKENQQFRQENVTNRIENKEEMEETVEKIAISNKISDPVVKMLANKLLEADLPVTEENLQSLTGAYLMMGAVNQLSDGGMAYMIDRNLPPTVENIYQSQHTGYVCSKGNSKEFEAIQDSAKNILTNAGKEITEEAMQKVKWLYENELPITEETITSIETMEEIKQTGMKDSVLDKMTDCMAKGKKPESANLDVSQEKKVETALSSFEQLERELFGNTDIESVTLRRKLEEVRLKMTKDVGLKLLSKGISLNTTNLEKIIEELRGIEDAYYKGLLSESGVKTANENVNLLKNTVTALDDLKEAPSYIIGSTLKQRRIQTISSLQEEAASVKAKLLQAGESYESLMTKPRQDMGDSIRKAFQNVSEILNEMGLENSEPNQRAVRILAHNQMEITQSNIDDVKFYDNKVNSLLKEMKPSVTVELIKRNINPMETTIDDLTNQVKEISNEIGASEEEKYSRYLWKLDQNHAITQDQRKSYIGIYRLLNQIEKNDSAEIGAILHNGMDLTLKNLLSAVRSRKAGGMDYQVDDNFGTLENLDYTGEKITDQIEAALSNDTKNPNESGSDNKERYRQTIENPELVKQEYYQNVVEDILEVISPKKLFSIQKEGKEDITNMTVEKFRDSLNEQPEDVALNQEYIKRTTESIRDLTKNSKEAITFLESFGQECNVKNITAYNAFFTNRKNLFKDFPKDVDKEYSELVHGITEAIEDADTLQAKYHEVGSKMQLMLRKAYKEEAKEGNRQRADELRIYANGIALAKKLSRQEHYEIPVQTGSEVTRMNLTFLRGTNDNGRIRLHMDSESLGTFEGEFIVKDQTIKGFIMCDSRDGLEAMGQAKPEISEGLQKISLNVGEISIGYDRNVLENRQLKERTPNEESATRTLYQAAKVLVKAIGETIQNKQ